MNRKLELAAAKRVSLDAVSLGKKLQLQLHDVTKTPVSELVIDEMQPSDSSDELLSIVEEKVSSMIENLFSFVSVCYS